MTDGPPDHFDKPDEFPDEHELPDAAPDPEDINPFEIDDDEISGDINDFSAAEWLAQRLDSTEKRNLVADIVGHPSAPSLEELDYMNPRMDSEEIGRELSELVGGDVVRVLNAESIDVGVEKAPEEFYCLTDGAQKGVDAADRYPREAWTREYSAVEKPERIQRLETLPRPLQEE